ncbi:TetR/AcrR family transcriptional regulator [Mycobacterium sp. 3519A]|uniref:TetR/AcrR family transcriptional regulator n=1 Tax=Mycobacterium sp. 3519A TaxID=2057184 RepID=UPI000C7BBC9E|nr:TetR/AcrR family transcriptional regulator [Mycobacterium sp. 3519A]
MTSLREQKRVRTRQALIDAAAALFEQRGYDGTTIADIAAAANVSTRTFFSYFATKEEVLFPDADARITAALTAIDERRPGERPTAILLRALAELGEVGDDLVGPMAALRLRFMRSVPAVRGRGLQLQLDGQIAIAARLHAAFPDELDEVEAAALVGAFVGAIAGALRVLLRDEHEPRVVRERLQRATAVALRPWV